MYIQELIELVGEMEEAIQRGKLYSWGCRIVMCPHALANSYNGGW